MKAAAPLPARCPWWPAALIAVVVCLSYWGSLHGAFVFDDGPGIVGNPTLRHPSNLRWLLFPPGEQAGTVGGRPLLNASLALNYALGGTNPFGYHSVNLALHVGSALLLFGLVRRTPHPVLRRWPLGAALAAALVWAVHPLTTQAVTYVIQRAESLMGLCLLLTLYCSVRNWKAGAVLACIAGMATKEPMAAAPLIVLLYDRAFRFGTFRSAWAGRRGFYLGLASAWVLLAALVLSTHGRGGSAGFSAGVGVWPYLLTQCRAIVVYLARALWPSPLVFDYGIRLDTRLGDVAGQVLVVVTLLAATVWALVRQPALGFIGAWFFLILGPSSSVVPIATEPIAEHRMYLPLAAIVVLAVAAAARWLPGKGAAVAGCVAAACLAMGTLVRNQDYRSAVALWRDTVAKRPDNPRAHNDLGTALSESGDGEAGLREFAAAVAADPSYLPAEYNLGVHLLDAHRPSEALPHLRRAAGLPRQQGPLQLYLAQALLALRRFGEAEEPLRRAVALSPGDPELHNDLANVLLLLKRPAAAADEYRSALRLRPGDPGIEANLRLLDESARP